MTETEIPDAPAAANGSDPVGSPGNGDSLLSGLRARRQELLKERHLDLNIPGYGGELVCRYRPIPWEAARNIARKTARMKDHPRRELDGWADELIAACDQFYIRQGGELVPVAPDGELPVRYDERLAQGLGFEAGSARQVLYRVFNNDIAVSAHHDEFLAWLRGNGEDDLGAEGEVDRAFRGE